MLNKCIVSAPQNFLCGYKALKDINQGDGPGTMCYFTDFFSAEDGPGRKRKQNKIIFGLYVPDTKLDLIIISQDLSVIPRSSFYESHFTKK